MVWCDDCGDTYDRQHRELDKDSRGRIRCHRPRLDCNTCSSSFRPSAPVLDDDRMGWEIHNCSPCPHCGAPRKWERSPCPCPQGLIDTARDKVDQDARNEAIAKAQQEAAAQSKLDRAIFEKEREERQRPEAERQEKYFKETIAASKKVRERKERDNDLRDRRQGVEARELTRSEKRLDNYAAADADGQVEDMEEPLTAFEMPMDGSDLDLAPTAMLQRKDGATLFYDGTLNFLFGAPGSGKSWVALHAIHETLLRDRRAIYWDHEDTPSTLKRRSSLIGLDLPYFWGEGQFKYLRPGLGRFCLSHGRGDGVGEGKRWPDADSH